MRRNRGFTLIEIAIVLLVISFALGSMLLPISASNLNRQIRETQLELDEIKVAIVNYTMINGFLPCPDTDFTGNNFSSIDGRENRTAGTCNALVGVLPFATLDLPHSKDSWGQYYFYRVTGSFADNGTGTDGTGCSATPKSGISFEMCSTGDMNVYSSTTLTATVKVASSVPVIIFSTGKNRATMSSTEAENTDGDSDFIKTTFGRASDIIPFDDMVIWISSNELIGAMINAGQLP